LSQQFASHGLQFFKVNKTVTHVSVARPQYLDIESNPVSDGIRRIVEYINSNAKCTRKKLIEALAPTPKRAAAPAPAPAAPAPAPAVPTPAPVAPTPTAEGEAAPVAESQAAPVPAKPAEPSAPEPTAEQTAVMVDLHWLIHQGAVLEFADGRMETAKKPLPKPVRPERKEANPQTEPAPAPEAATVPAEVVAVAEAAPAPEPVAVTVEAEPAPAPEAHAAPVPELPATSESASAA
jgi:hypothetical protein